MSCTPKKRRNPESTHVRPIFGNPRANHSSQEKCSLSEQNRVLFKLKLWVGVLAFWNRVFFFPCLHPMFLGYTLLCDIQDCQTFWSHRHSAHNQSQYALSKLGLFSADDNYVLYAYMLMSLWHRIVRLGCWLLTICYLIIFGVALCLDCSSICPVAPLRQQLVSQ